MGFFSDIFNQNKSGNTSKQPDTKQQNNENEIVLSASSRIVTDTDIGDNKKYSISFKLNDSFKQTKSHASEIEMLYTYDLDNEYGTEGAYPYLAIQLDDEVYCAVEEFKKNGSFEGAIELVPLAGTFYFKAKMNYYDCMMYFYGIDRCDGFWENNGLCIVYPKELVGTESEKKLMSVLDQAAHSYCETLKS